MERAQIATTTEMEIITILMADITTPEIQMTIIIRERITAEDVADLRQKTTTFGTAGTATSKASKVLNTRQMRKLIKEITVRRMVEALGATVAMLVTCGTSTRRRVFRKTPRC